MPAGIGAVRPPAPDLGEREHLGEHAEHPVGLVGRGAQGMVQFRNVPAQDLAGRHAADRGDDQLLHHPAVVRLGERLAVHRDIVLQKPAPEIRHRRRRVLLPVPLAIWALARIDALPRQRRDPLRLRPRIVGAHAPVAHAPLAGRAAGPEGEPAQPAAHAGLEHPGLPARCADPDAETGQLAVPIDGVAIVCRDRAGGAVGQSGYPIYHAVRAFPYAPDPAGPANNRQTESADSVRNAARCDRTESAGIPIIQCVIRFRSRRTL